MTRDLALDALRYVTRTYKDDAAHNRKMYRRYGGDWAAAKIAAGKVVTDHGDRECYAVLLDMVYRAIDGDVQKPERQGLGQFGGLS